MMSIRDTAPEDVPALAAEVRQRLKQALDALA